MQVQALPQVAAASCTTSMVPQEAPLLNRLNLKSFIESMKGLFVSVDFKKLDGSKRTLTGRLGVRSYLRGGRNTVEADSRPYLTVFDVALGAYRTVNLATVSRIRAQGKEFSITG